MYILGIESTCDETAASVVEDGRVLKSSVIASSCAEQALYGGVVPEIASRRHIEAISATVGQALEEAELKPEQLDGIAVSFAPGLIGAVLVGVNFAKGLAYSVSKPLIPVHHLRGHIAALYLTHPDLEPPFLCLVASGGHSHIVQVEDYTHFHVLGRTVDDAAGEAFDKVARTLGLPYPGGPSVSKAAVTGDPHAYRLPVPHVEGKYNVSFSGLKTAVLNRVNQAEMKGETISVPDMAACFQVEYRRSDPMLTVTAEETAAAWLPMDAASTERTLCLLACAPNGVQTMSQDIHGLVQTSLNLGILKTEENAVTASFCIRSSVDSEKEMLKDRLACLLAQLGGRVSFSGEYPGWAYRPDSPLRELMTEVYREQYGREPKVEAIHAGLECGLLAGKLPGLDCVSIGPDLLEIHTPREKMSISSVQRVWAFVREVLKRSK